MALQALEEAKQSLLENRVKILLDEGLPVDFRGCFLGRGGAKTFESF